MGLLTNKGTEMRPYDMWIVQRADGDIVNRWNNPYGMYGLRVRPEFEKYDGYLKSVGEYLLPDLCSKSETFIRAYIKTMQSEREEDIGFETGMHSSIYLPIDDVGIDIIKSFYIDYFQTTMVDMNKDIQLFRRYVTTSVATYYLLYKVRIEDESMNTFLWRKEDWVRFTSRT